MASHLLKSFPESARLDEENLGKITTILKNRMIEIRTEIHRDLKEKYNQEFPKWITKAEDIAKDIRDQKSEIGKNSKRIKELLNEWTDTWNVDKIKSIRKEMTETGSRLTKLRSLVDIYETLENLESIERHHKRDFTKRAELISSLDRSLNSLFIVQGEKRPQSAVEGEDFNITSSMLKTLKQELIVHKESFIFDVYEEWGETFSWDIDKDDTNRLVINIGPRFNDAVVALEELDLLNKKSDHFGKCIMNYLLIPLLNEDGSRLKFLFFSDDESKLEITLLKSDEDQEQPRTLANMFEDCGQLFQLLHEKLDVPLKGGKSFSLCLIENILKSLKELIVESILKPAIPSDIGEMPNFDFLLTTCDTFLQKLKLLGLIAENESSFAEFASNVDTLFLGKRCQAILGQAHRLIATELHATVQVGGQSTVTNDAEILKKLLRDMLLQKQEAEEKEKMLPKLDFEKPLPPLKEFPVCRVSTSVVSLLELIMKTLDESATATSPFASARLYHCARNIVELYLDVCPARHEVQLKNIPQLTAVFYNNCYFLCHYLLTLGLTYESKLLPAMAVPSGLITVTFVDFIPRLKEMANESMDLQITKQSQYLIDCLKPAGGFVNASNAAQSSVCRKASKACVMQLQHVCRVWNQVLPATILLKFQGKLVDELLKHIVKTVVRLEDIAADDAKIIHEMFQDFLKDVESCFVIDKIPYTHRFCESGYFKFKELLFILNASLSEIEERWASGEGPLADYMDAFDVKQLIRALFQNTDRRAAVLAKIK